MPRPGFVLEVDDKTPPILTVGGTRLGLQRYGLGTRVAYPPDAEPSVEPTALLNAALEAPVGSAPLTQRLAEAKRVLIVFGDNTVPAPAMKFDVRRDVAEHVLDLAARARVDDVSLLVANGLHRRLTEKEFVGLLGERVVGSFLTQGALNNHDVTDEAHLVAIGEVDGREIRVNAEAVAADLIVNIVVYDKPRPPLAQLSFGLTDLATIDYIGGLEGQRNPQRAQAVADLLIEKLPVFTIEVVLGAPVFDAPLSFIGKREWEWKLADQLSWVGVRQLLAGVPKQATSRLFGSLKADYATLDVVAGAPVAAEAQARQAWAAAHEIALPDQVDVLVKSVWGVGGDATDPVGSPLAAAHRALADGPEVSAKALIAFHPLKNRFSNRHHSAAADFFADVLVATLEPDEIVEQFQERFTSDSWYLELYRTQHAYHPLHVFHEWYATQLARARFSEVVWVGADRRSAALLGHRASSTYADALEIVADRVGVRPNVLVLR